MSADGNNAGNLLRAGRHPGRRAGRHVPERRQVLPVRQHRRRPDHPDPDDDHLRLRRSRRCRPGRQGHRRVGRLPDPVREVPGEDRTGCSYEGSCRHEQETFASSRNLPVLVTLGLFIIMFGLGSVAFPGFFSRSELSQSLHRQRLPPDPRRGDDLRDHIGRHRPLRRLDARPVRDGFGEPPGKGSHEPRCS